MRITCPNCDAQYEVEDRLIPESGRDVQCSNCGHAWYFYPVGADLPDEDDELPGRPPGNTVTRDAPQRPPLDESLRAILREEAEREAAARAAEARRRAPAAVEVQGDLGLSPRPSARDAAAPHAAVSGAAPSHAAPARARTEPAPPAPAASASDRLPDLEAINSTLTAAAATPAVAPPPPARRGGFAQGFAAVFLVAALLFALYLFAPRIAAAVPALAGPLETYVATVEAAHRAIAALLHRGG